MAISTSRNKFLDKETSVLPSGLTGVVTNSVYTDARDPILPGIDTARASSGVLSSMSSNIQSVSKSVESLTEQGSSRIAKAIDSSIENVMSRSIPTYVSSALDKLKGLSLDGVKGFLGQVLKIGSVFLCDNLGRIKDLLIGKSISDHVLGGLILGLLLSWLDKFCKPFSSKESIVANNKGRLKQVIKGSGFVRKNDEMLDSFLSTSHKYVTKKRNLLTSLSKLKGA